MHTQIISAFPGTGKTHYSNNNYNILDSDSSSFSWLSKGVRNKNFPSNYISHIGERIGDYLIIFVSSHESVRSGLSKFGINFTLVYPHYDLKKEYLERFKIRGNDLHFIKMIDENWDKFFTQLINQKSCNHRILLSGEYITSVLGDRDYL